MGYPSKRKAAILLKMLPPNNQPITQLAIEEDIAQSTLYKWRATARANADADIMPTDEFLERLYECDQCTIILINMVSGRTLDLYDDDTLRGFLKDWEYLYSSLPGYPMDAYEHLMSFHEGVIDPAWKTILSMSYPKPIPVDLSQEMSFKEDVWVVKKRSDILWFCEDDPGITSAETSKNSLMNVLEDSIENFHWKKKNYLCDGGKLARNCKSSLAWLTDAFDESVIVTDNRAPADFMRDKLGLYHYEENEDLVVLKIPKILFEARDDIHRPTFFSANGHGRFKCQSASYIKQVAGTTADLSKFENGEDNIDGVPELVCDNITYEKGYSNISDVILFARLGKTKLSRKTEDGDKRFHLRLKAYEGSHSHKHKKLSKQLFKFL